MANDPLHGVRVKIAQAKNHLAHLEAEIRTFLDDQPYTLVVEEDAQARSRIYRVRISTPIPDQWGAQIGDIIHNLRSSLDLLAVALVIANGRTSKTAISETYFPIGASHQAYSTEKIRRADPKAIRLVERLRPYKGGIDAFWRLHQLDILDKHRLLVPVGASHTRVTIRFRSEHFGEQIAFPPYAITPADTQFPLKDGAEVLRYNAGVGPMPQPDDVHCTFTVAFGEGQVFDGEPVVQTLKQLVNFVERVVGLFAKQFFA